MSSSNYFVGTKSREFHVKKKKKKILHLHTIPSKIIYHDQANSRLTERVPMVCTSSPSSCLVWGIIPPMVTGRQICGYCENIYQVHKGRLTKFIKEKNKTRKSLYFNILTVLLNVFIVIYYCLCFKLSYPAFFLHFTFALVQSFLEQGLISLAAELLLSTDKRHT